MKNIVNTYVEQFRADRRRSRRMRLLLLTLALMVAGGVFWQLRDTGIALTNETYCGLEEHTHTEECYAQVLVCGLEESEAVEGHTHSEECYETQAVLVCGLEEGEGHTHDDSCYETEQVLVCALEESESIEGHTHTEDCYETQLICGLEEHTHTMACMSDERADVETAQDWEATLPALSGVWARDVVTIAESQLGYTESTANFTLAEDGQTRQGYTRYGAWAGNPYADWDAMFASFCLYYAGVPTEDFPESTGTYAWAVTLKNAGLYESAERYTPAAGDLVFFDTDGDGRIDRVGIVTEADGNSVSVIQGDSSDAVARNTYCLNDSAVIGFGVLPEQESDAAEETEQYTLTCEGEGYIVTVTYGADAGLPEDVALVVSEYDRDSEIYQTRYAQAAALYGWGEEEQDFRLFDIGLYADGEEVEPAAAVEVTISYLAKDGLTAYDVTHYSDEGAQNIDASSDYADGTQSIRFSTDGFSEYGVSPASNETGGTSDIGEELDDDYAYLSDVAMVADSTTTSGYAMRTGTAPWDDDDEPGNDSTDLNNSLRTYDVATYTVTFTSRVRDGAPYKFYYEGNLYFEFILQGDSTEVQFETGSMGWLDAKNATYIVTEETIDGEVCQVLRGYYLWQPASGNDHAIGESTQELTLAIRALALSNGDTITPTFTFWLEGNEVGVDYSDWGTDDYDGGVVTGSNATCSTHSETEYQTITAPSITISAVASYNIVVTASSESTTGTFDFSTGTDSALNKSAGSVTGRLASYGITIQIVGKSATEGLRGIELPKSGEAITFTLTLSSSAQYDDITMDTTDAFTPLVWSLEGNSSSASQTDGRSLPSELNCKCALYAPLNKNTSGAHNSCYDGGTWTGTQSDNTVSITISDWQLKMSLDVLPYSYAIESTLSTTYYDPSAVSNYWEIQYACISAGELWVVQPFYTTDGKYILDYLDTDDMSFTTTVKDSNLSMQDDLGNTITEQAVTTDDTATQDMALVRPGTIIQSIAYQKYNRSVWNDPVTEGCWGTPKDWILAGNQLAIFDWITNESAEGEYTAVAYDELIKFDDAFFEPDGTVTAATLNSSVLAVKPTILYGAKADKSGWSHTDSQGNVLSPGDDGYDTEMINATTDDLVYFTSLSALKEAGYTCVAVLVEWRGLASTSYNHTDVTIKGTAKTTAETDCVYMVTHYGRSWNRSDLAKACAESGKEAYANYTVDDIVNMSADEIKTLVDELIPSRAATAIDAGYTAGDAPLYATDYPSSCYWINGGRDGTSSQSNLIRNYIKAAYDENGYVSGATSGVYYGDSCLLVGYTTGVTLNVAQTTDGGAEKAAYDMDTGQRIVDYALQAYITRNAGESTSQGQTQTTDITMTVTLPAGLTYLEGSSYIGGTYTTNGEGVQGTVTDGTQLKENGTVTVYDESGNALYTVKMSLEKNEDGTTTLTYTLSGVTLTSDLTQYLDTIHFSCQIGTEGNEETDVQNGDSLTVSATSESTEDCNRDFTATNGNYSECGILISKNSASALAKFADQSVVDVGEAMGFTLHVDNNSTNSVTVRAVEGLPYSGDGVSSFTGDVVVTEFRVYSSASTDESGNTTYVYDAATAGYTNIKFYYTTDESYRGKDSEDLKDEDFTNTANWTELTISNGGTAELPTGTFTPVAIVAVGTLPASTTLRMHISITLPDGQGGDYVVNKLSNYNTTSLTSSARCRIVSRTLSGLAWVDLDGDGIQDTGEISINGVTVELLKLNDGGDATKEGDYTVVATTTTGNTYDVQTANETAYTDGYYQFTSLSEGTYAVRFTTPTGMTATINSTGGTTFAMAEYVASPVDAGDDDDKDSDATGTYSGYTLSQTLITGIEMPAASELTYSTYASVHHDSGFFQYQLQITKVDTDDESKLLEGATFKLTKQSDLSFELTDTTDSDGIATFGTPSTYQGLTAGVYILEETQAPDGYNDLEGTITITIGTAGTFTAVGTDTNTKYYTDASDGQLLKVTVTNGAGYELPLTGGAGVWRYTWAGLTLCGSAGLLLTRRRRKRAAR